MFSFYIKRPEDIMATLRNVEYKVTSSGGKFSGDTVSGAFANAKKDVIGKYLVGDEAIKITITRKPFIYPNSAVEGRIREYFSQ